MHACRRKHVHHVVGCSNQHRNSTLRWGRKPATKVQAISEEVVDSVAGNGTQNGNGTVSATVAVEQSTLSVHAGESGGRCKVSDSLTTPICCTSTYYFQDTAELIAYQEGRYGSYEYGRCTKQYDDVLHSAPCLSKSLSAHPCMSLQLEATFLTIYSASMCCMEELHALDTQPKRHMAVQIGCVHRCIAAFMTSH